MPVIVWMCLIFTASSDQASSQHSSRIIEPILRWLLPNLGNETVQTVVYVVRKCAHLTEYAVLWWLVWRALRKPVQNDSRPWKWSEAFLALGWVALYAASDEVHQLFVASREGKVTDVLLDSIGGMLGLAALWVVGGWRKRWKRKLA